MDEEDHKVYKFTYTPKKDETIEPIIIGDGKELKRLQTINLKKGDTFTYEYTAHVNIQ